MHIMLHHQDSPSVEFWLRVSYELSIQLLTKAAVISKLGWSWRIHFQAHSCGCWQTPGDCSPSSLTQVLTVGMLMKALLHSLMCGLLHKLPECPYDMATNDPSDKARVFEYMRLSISMPQSFYNFMLEVNTIMSRINYSLVICQLVQLMLKGRELHQGMDH